MRRTIDDCKSYILPKIGEREGMLTTINRDFDLPFIFKRIFYIYDIPNGESRGAHAHKECHQLLIAISGSFTVVINDGNSIAEINLNSPNIGLHIPPGIWASEENFSGGSICLVIASHPFSEDDYIRNFKNYLEFIK